AMIIDFSGSMHLGSVLGGPVTDSTGQNIVGRSQALNGETTWPKFGHYFQALSRTNASDTSNLLNWRGTAANPPPDIIAASGETLSGSSNVVDGTTGNGTAIVTDFSSGTTPFGYTQAFSPQPTSYDTNPGGLKPPYKSGSTVNFAINVNEVIGNAY